MSHLLRQNGSPAVLPQQPASNPINQKRQMQQFYLHKSFDLESDIEFLPLIPQDPVVTAIQMHETMAMQKAQFGGLAQGISPVLNRQDAITLYNQAPQRARPHSGHFLHQHLFGGKRANYVQNRSH
ncbi:hypothetical protein FDK38_002609 [Candidozyma auris]|uniref:hypothetical_protein n=1 Tax=Candidozyma auris TaxID=498019 RepID=UPI000D29F6DA|nr:hypothetical_protein [[Candida] auris]QEO20277.1 hypothetical_protein [[Candida] auris]QRG38210.1 hypothetical protein FDK38_002609 [[Candida] auris]GBL49750.1 hypothetical protein CAJCM15448_20240 [[Candida] auris]